jgi:hypothetical protein
MKQNLNLEHWIERLKMVNQLIQNQKIKFRDNFSFIFFLKILENLKNYNDHRI